MSKPQRTLVICVDNINYPIDLVLRKIYVSLPDASAMKHGMVRVIDESGEDYLYPASGFVPVQLPPEARRAVLAAVDDVADGEAEESSGEHPARVGTVEARPGRRPRRAVPARG